MKYKKNIPQIWRVSVKQLNPPYENLIGRIFAYSFDAEASKAPSDEGAVSEAD